VIYRWVCRTTNSVVPQGTAEEVSMAHSFVNQLLHCVFSTKERRPLITPDLQARLYPYLGGIARENKMKLMAAGGVADHVHLLVSLPSTLSVAKAMQLVKAVHQNGFMTLSPNTAALSGKKATRRFQSV